MSYISFILSLIDEKVNHYNDGGGHIESSNIYDEAASFDSIANAQTDMICHYDEVVNFGSMGDAQIDMICNPDIVATFDVFLLCQNLSDLLLIFLHTEFNSRLYKCKDLQV